MFQIIRTLKPIWAKSSILTPYLKFGESQRNLKVERNESAINPKF